MDKILWISKYVPYDMVRHAGGKTHNFYIKELNKVENVDIFLISFADKSDHYEPDHLEKGLNSSVFVYPEKGEKNFLKKKFYNVGRRINVYDRYGGMCQKFDLYIIEKKLNELKQKGYKPDTIVLQWTQIVLFLQKIKKYFPDAKFIAVEEDVSFLGYNRKWKQENNRIKKWIKGVQYKKLKKLELNTISKFDEVITYNYKDAKLLETNLINQNKIKVISPFYDDYSECKYNPSTNDIIFYGAMSREENYKSAEWFIKNVMPKLPEEIRFVVIGNKPPQYLIEMQNDRIIITGYIEDIRPYFEQSLALVAPLVLGAGIKVKILEAMSAGIPVICNDIAIEGIEAIDGNDYLYCKDVDEYVNAIIKIQKDLNLAQNLGQNEKKLVKEKYNYYKDCDRLEQIIRKG